LVEDDIRYYSSFLPMIYLEIMNQSQRLISEGINLSHKKLRQRARPKILLSTNYEEAWDYFIRYKDNILGIISDIEFPHRSKIDSQAGLKFARNVLREQPNIPILLNSNLPVNKEKAKKTGASFMAKDSLTLMQELRQFMINYLNFGDFIFRTPDGKEVDRAHDLISLEKALENLPEESMKYHAERNHFSNWLKARTEFWLAHQLRPRKVSDFSSITEMRNDLISSLKEYRKLRQRGIITDFYKESFDPYSSISRIGGGSLGGKARGLSFVNILINNYNIQNRFKNVRIYIPPAIVIGTDIFDQFLDENNLRDFALHATDDKQIVKRFLEAKKFPEEILGELASFLDLVDSPLAVRSSSLLEDSHNHPFAGVYKTYMLPNSHQESIVRLFELLKAVKRVYASTFFQSAKDYIKATSYRLEEEKMAVIVQKMIGSKYHNRFYPGLSGVARSYNFYPIHPQKFSDGIIFIALGLGKMVVEGGSTVRFCPKYPNHLDQFSSPKTALKNYQNEFYAIDMAGDVKNSVETKDYFVKKFPLKSAEKDGTLFFSASTYTPEDDTIHDGLSRNGIRLVTFAPILKNNIFPLTEISDLLLDMGGWGMGTGVEIEFAVDLPSPKGKPVEFGLLQMRPMVLNRDLEVLNIDEYKPEELICHTNQVLGNGIFDNIFDIVVVDRDRFDRSKSPMVAQEVSDYNHKLLSENRRYLLIGVGRWGSLDPWLGIPVTWAQISGAQAIVETDFKDFTVMPSLGSHFFQNLNSFQIGYYSVRSRMDQSYIDWDWLIKQKAIEEKGFTRLLRFNKPIVIKMSGHQNIGIILKPEDNIAQS
jgi:hypothetical protein